VERQALEPPRQRVEPVPAVIFKRMVGRPGRRQEAVEVALALNWAKAANLVQDHLAEGAWGEEVQEPRQLAAQALSAAWF